MLVLSPILVVGSLCCIFLIEKYGRRKLLIIGYSIQFISLIVIRIDFGFSGDLSNNFVMAFTMISLFGHGLSSGPITYVYLTDILPDIGVAFCLFFNWCFASLITFSALLLDWNKHQKTVFDVFVFSSLFAVVFMVLIVEETKGKSQKEIWYKMSQD